MIKNNKGFVLPGVLLIMLVLIVLGMAFIFISSGEATHAISHEKSIQSHYMARSGVEVGKNAFYDFAIDPINSSLTDINDLISSANLLSLNSSITDADGDVIGNYEISYALSGQNQVKVISDGIAQGPLSSSKTVTYTMTVTPRGVWKDAPTEWVRGNRQNLWDDVDPNLIDFLGEGVLFSGAPTKSPQSGAASTFRASIMYFIGTDSKGDTFWQQPQTNNFAFDAEIIKFDGKVWTRSANDFKLEISDTTVSNDDMWWGYPDSVGFESFDRYEHFIDTVDASSTTGPDQHHNSYNFDDAYLYGLIHFSDDVISGNSRLLKLESGYYFYKHGLDLTDTFTIQSATSTPDEDDVFDLIEIKDNDPIIDALDSLFMGFSVLQEGGVYDDK